jgi:hypothetical protein
MDGSLTSWPGRATGPWRRARRFSVVVRERQEQAPPALGADRNDADGADGLAVHGAAAQVQRILAEAAGDQSMLAGELDVLQPQPDRVLIGDLRGCVPGRP